MSDLYDQDIVLWSEQQAERLRRHAADGRMNSTDLDWVNIIEEIESVGNSELRAVESLLRQALTHALKIRAWPGASHTGHWRVEVRVFRGEAVDRCTASMRRRIDLTRVWRRALQGMPDDIDGQPPSPVPETCPDTLDQLLSGAACAMFPEEDGASLP